MIYTCPHCGAWFPAKDITAAIAAKSTTIICKSCGNISKFQDMRSSYTARGFEYLEKGDFYNATVNFTRAIDDAKKHLHSPSSEAYLGQALAQFRVQTVFGDEDTGHDRMPEIICHHCNELNFVDSKAYQDAEESIKKEASEDMKAGELAKLKAYADYIDGLKECYNGIERTKGSNFSYSVFIAYEDKATDADNRGYEMAGRVRNKLPGIKNVFLPDRDSEASDVLYDAEVLFALHHSACMLVITDNDIDSHLTNLYSRFYYISRDERKKGGNNLGFVRYLDKITISLPDKTIARKNVFDIDDERAYRNFVASHCGIAILAPVSGGNTLHAQPEPVSAEPLEADDFGDDKPYHSLPGKQIAFGHYPQRRVQQPEVLALFDKFERPSLSDSKGWTVLSHTKKGNPHMWYRDAELNGKKYRAVYFTRYRDLYTVQTSDIPSDSQKKNGYLPMRVYCFAFEPLIWNIQNMTNNVAVLVADHGIDCCPYNEQNLTNDWQLSTMHRWLNETFLQTAFSEAEQDYLGMLDCNGENDRIYLVDQTFDRRFYSKSQSSIRGSDYYRCIGGVGEYDIGSYWITANVNLDGSEAGVVYPASKNSLGTQYVDCSGVAVLPKVVVKLN